MSKREHITQIIERQVRSWDSRHKQLVSESGEAARRALASLKEGPWLTLSRQHGAGGDRIAELVAQKVGWQVYDREILKLIVEHTPARQRVLEGLEQEVVRPLDELLGRLLVNLAPPQVALVREMGRIIWSLGRKGNAIIVGRGANWLLAASAGLRVRVVAPLDVRAAQLASATAISEDEARRECQKHDEARREFVRHYFLHDIDDALGYDLVLNTGVIGIEDAARIVTDALRIKLHVEPALD